MATKKPEIKKESKETPKEVVCGLCAGRGLRDGNTLCGDCNGHGKK